LIGGAVGFFRPHPASNAGVPEIELPAPALPSPEQRHEQALKESLELVANPRREYFNPA